MPGSSGLCWPMMRRIDHPPRCRKVDTVFRRRGDASRITSGGFTPRSAARTIRDDTRGTPSAFRPWTKCRPNQGRCAHEENARVFHQGPDTAVVHREAGYIHAALCLPGASRDTPSLPRRLGPYIKLCSTPPHSSSFQPAPAKIRFSSNPWLDLA